MNILDYWLGKYRWYRRARGGLWCLIGPSPSLPAIDEFWIKGEPKVFERVYAREYHPWPR